MTSAEDQASAQSSHSSQSSSIGLSAQFNEHGAAFGVTANAAYAKGSDQGESTTHVNTQVNAGNKVTIDSGGDVTLDGAQVRAKQVTGDIAGNLIINSPQDTASAKSRGESASLGGTFGTGATVSAQASKSQVDADYAATNQHSGIHAGDDGFQITTGGATYLNGGVIVSTQEAIDQNKNILDTAAIVHSDVDNRSNHTAKASTIGTGGAAVVKQDKDNTSVTQSGVSQGQLIIRDEQLQQTLTGQTTEEAKASVNRTLTTDNLPGKLEQHWNVQEIEQEVTSQATAIASVSKAIAKEVGDFTQAKAEEAKAKGNEEGVKMWDEGGAARTALHAVTGAITGDLAGAVGAAAGSLAAPILEKVQDGITNALKDAGASDAVAKETGKIVSSVAAAVTGAAIAGPQGAAAAFNVDTFNRQLTHSEKQLAKELADKSNGKYTAEQIEEQMRGMTVTQNGKTELGTPDTVIGGVPTDTGGTWLHSGTTDDGRPIVTQQLAPENLELRAYIVKNTTGTGVPGPIMYEGPFKAPQPASVETRQLSTARCANGDYNCAAGLPLPLTEAEKQRRLNAAADVANTISTQSGRVAAAATAYRTILANGPNPLSQAAAAAQSGVAVGAMVVGLTSSAIEQLLRPDLGSMSTYTAQLILGDLAQKVSPLAAPITNEIINQMQNTPEINRWKDSINRKD